jgi:hypothetical protein
MIELFPSLLFLKHVSATCYADSSPLICSTDHILQTTLPTYLPELRKASETPHKYSP